MRFSRLSAGLIVIAGMFAAGGRGAAEPQNPPAAPGSSEGTAAISGVVVDARTSRPVAGAVVSLGKQGPAANAGFSRQLTDAKGRFVFRSLPAADSYVINTSKFGYFDAGYGQSALRSTQSRIVLVDGQWFSDARISLQRPAAINGSVLDERGEPVVGVFVRVLAQVLVSGRPQVAAGPVGKTDDRGAYRIAGLAPGRYLVSVPSAQNTVLPSTIPATLHGMSAESAATAEAAGRDLALVPVVDVQPGSRLVVGRFAVPPAPADGRSAAYPILFYPNARSIADASPIDLDYGDDRAGVDFRLQLLPAVRVSGVVDGPPDALSGLLLRLVPAGCEDLGDGSEAATTLVSPDGTFTFLNVPSGAYTLEARRSVSEYSLRPTPDFQLALPRAPGVVDAGFSIMGVSSATPGTSYLTRTTKGNASYWGRLALAVDARDVSNVTLTLHRGVSLSGRIVLENQKTKPFRVFARAEPAGGNASLGMPGTMPSMPEAPLFSIEGLFPGEYFLRVLVGDAVVKSITWNGRDYTYAPFDAAAGRDFADIVVTVGDKPVSLMGTVRSAQGGAVTQAAVIVFPVEREQWTGYGFAPPRIRSVTVTTSGGYRLAPLPAGEYFVVAVDPSQSTAWQDPRFFEAVQSSAARVSLEWGDSKTQDLVMVVR